MYRNGYGPTMRAFTRISKVLFSHLFHLGHSSGAYVDNSYLQVDSCKTCFDNVTETIELLGEFGFIIYPA